MRKFTFSSFPDFSDNAFSVTKCMLDNNVKGAYIWLVEDITKKAYFENKANRYFGNNSSKVKFVKKKSISGIWHYFTSKMTFNTHGSFEQIPLLPYQKKINLWHGMPLKNIGHLTGSKTKLRMNYTISTAPIFNKLMAEAFQIENMQVLSSGLPRNDLFFQKSKFSIREIENNADKVFVWLPTYRKSAIGDCGIDGDYEVDTLGGFTSAELDLLNSHLEKENVKVVVKLHPMDILNQKNFGQELSHIKIIKQQEFSQLNIEINDFLKDSDGLITDYSSVYFDYLLLKKPIALISKDSESYKNSRGFTSKEVFDNFKGFPIVDVQTFSQFISCNNLTDEMNQLNFFNQYDNAGNNSMELLKKLKIL